MVAEELLEPLEDEPDDPELPEDDPELPDELLPEVPLEPLLVELLEPEEDPEDEPELPEAEPDWATTGAASEVPAPVDVW